MQPLRRPDATEASLARRWAAGVPGPLRLADGRPLAVVFPGVPGPGQGPDFTGAILDADGDLLRGDVELHLRSSGWRTHGHATDPAYGNVVLHVVALDDTGAARTLHASGRTIPLLVLDPGPLPYPPPFSPPCALSHRQGQDHAAALERLSLRRLRVKAARVGPAVASSGPGQALYGLLLETLGGTANRAAFAEAARRQPLAPLIATHVPDGVTRAAAIRAVLGPALPRALPGGRGSRPAASPARRLDAAAALIDRWWPEGAAPGWPTALPPRAGWQAASVPGLGRSAAIECLVNAVLPSALASGAWPAGEVERAWLEAPTPGTYGRLKSLAGWLAGPGQTPFTTAARLQGGLLLHYDYCTRGACGRCPLSPP